MQNPALVDVTALGALGTVTGDVYIRLNTALPSADADALVASITSIGGTTTVSDNGP